MTILEILNEEKIIDFVDCFRMKNVNLFRVVDITNKDIILVVHDYKIQKLEKKNKFTWSNFCRNIKFENRTNRIELIDNSFFYLFKIELYYIDNFLTNLVSILKLHFLDYNNNNNKFNCIISPLFKEDKIISNEIE